MNLTIIVFYRIACLTIGLFAAVSGVWWFAVVMVIMALLAEYHQGK